MHFLALVPRAIFGSENLNEIFGVTMFFGGAGILVGPPIVSICMKFDSRKTY